LTAFSFYSAMLCIARTMLSKDVCLSVRSSVHLSIRLSISLLDCYTPVYPSKQLNISADLSPSVSHIILVFLTKRSDGDPLMEGSNERWCEKSRDLGPYRALSRKWYNYGMRI